jgi:hypothetical protein
MLLVYQTPKSPKLVTRRIFNPHAQWRVQGEMGDTSPAGLKHRGLERSLFVTTTNFFGASRRLLFN